MATPPRPHCRAGMQVPGKREMPIQTAASPPNPRSSAHWDPHLRTDISTRNAGRNGIDRRVCNYLPIFVLSFHHRLCLTHHHHSNLSEWGSDITGAVVTDCVLTILDCLLRRQPSPPLWPGPQHSQLLTPTSSWGAEHRVPQAGNVRRAPAGSQDWVSLKP